MIYAPIYIQMNVKVLIILSNLVLLETYIKKKIAYHKVALIHPIAIISIIKLTSGKKVKQYPAMSKPYKI